MFNSLLAVLIGLGMTCSAAAATGTAWPPEIGMLKPDTPKSPVATEFPADASVTPPGADVPPDKARWSGLWSGWACVDRSCDIKLAVLSVTAQGAKVIQLYGARNATPNPAVRDAVFVEDELQINAGNLKVAYRMRPGEVIEMLRTAPNGSTAWGVLQKAK